MAIYAAGTGAVVLAPAHGSVASWWPAAGLAVSLIALAPRSWCPVLAAGIVVFSGAANLTGGRDLDVSLLFGLANAAEAVVAGLLLKSPPDDRPRLECLDDFVRLVKASLAGGLTIATGAALTVAVFDGGEFLSTWPQVFASHAASTLVIVPVAMRRAAVRRTRHRWSWSSRRCPVAVTCSCSRRTRGCRSPSPRCRCWSGRPCASTSGSSPGSCWGSAHVHPLTARVSGRSAPRSRPATLELTAGTMVQVWLLSAAAHVAAADRRHRAAPALLAEVTARELLFRRNFTESLVGMLLLQPRGDRLEIVDLNDAAVRMLGGVRDPLVGRYLDRVLATRRGRSSIARSSPARATAGRPSAAWSSAPAPASTSRSRCCPSEPEPLFAAQLLDVTAEHEARRQLEAAERLTSATLDTTACIIMVTDLDGTVVRVNEATTALTGFTEAELVGRPVWELPSRRRGAGDWSLPDAATGPASQVARVGRADQHGEQLRVVWNTNIVRDDHGARRTPCMTGIDVTAERNAAGLVDPPAGGVDHHRADRHRHRAAGSPCSTPAPSTCSATTRHDADRHAVRRPARPRGARRRAPARTARAEQRSRRWSRGIGAPARASPATGPGSAATAAGTSSR